MEEEEEEEEDEGDRVAMEWDDWLASMVDWFAHRELRQQKDHEKLVSAITSVRKRGTSNIQNILANGHNGHDGHNGHNELHDPSKLGGYTSATGIIIR